KDFEAPGVLLDVMFLDELADDGHQQAVGEGANREVDLAILESLGLIRKVALNISFDRGRRKTSKAEVHYYHLTDLGISFCEVCSRPRILQLQQIDRSNGG